MYKYFDSYYYFILVKCIKQFINTFTNMLIIIFQNDKVKIRLKIPVIDYILQSINKFIIIVDYDFLLNSNKN